MKKNILHSNDLKNTKSRQIILSVLEKSSSPLTAETIYSTVIKKSNISISTIYRTLATLSEKKILLKDLSQDGKTYYQINNNKHKHNLRCTLCNEIIGIDICPLNLLEKELIKKTGYIITGHNLEFSGICPKCSKKK